VRYRIQFASDTVGQAKITPFEVEVPEGLTSPALAADLTRKVRDKVVQALTYSPAPRAISNVSELSAGTQVLLDVMSGRGAVYFGTDTIADVTLRPIP
jgi:hypothetical protein